MVGGNSQKPGLRDMMLCLRQSTRTGLIALVLVDQLHELGGVEVNVATRYHAIEFMLWGQDLNAMVPAEWPGNCRRILLAQSRLVITAPCHPIEAPCPG